MNNTNEGKQSGVAFTFISEVQTIAPAFTMGLWGLSAKQEVELTLCTGSKCKCCVFFMSIDRSNSTNQIQTLTREIIDYILIIQVETVVFDVCFGMYRGSVTNPAVCFNKRRYFCFSSSTGFVFQMSWGRGGGVSGFTDLEALGRLNDEIPPPSQVQVQLQHLLWATRSNFDPDYCFISFQNVP